MQLPIEFVEKMKRLLGDSANDFFEQLDRQSYKGITVNYSRMGKDEFENACNFEISPIEHIDNGYYVNNFKFSTNIFNHLGIIYSQEPSAMYPVEMLDVQPNDTILDLCASPGGKSIQILEKLNNTGLLVSNEIIFNRSKILYENLNRMGFKNFAITCNSPEDYSETSLKFDKILIDAPCGGEGMLRKKDFDLNVYNPNAIESNAKRQLLILNSVKDLLKCGGRLVYSTCTYDIRENEDVIAKFLDENDNFRIVRYEQLNDVMCSGIKVDNHNTQYAFRRYPHLHKGEGQFMIALEKIGEEELEQASFKCSKYSIPHNKELDIINKQLKTYTTLGNLNIVKRNDTFYVIPRQTIDFESLNVIHIGCEIGTLNKNIFKFNHNFYHTYGNEFINKINLNENDTNKLLHGEEIEVNVPDGIYVATFYNIPISGGKVVNGKLKNNYPKELRI